MTKSIEEPAPTWSGHSTIAHGGALRAPSPPSVTERSYLAVFTENSSFVFHLPTTGDVRIGRGRDIELRVEGHAISRKHTLLRVVDGRVSARDMGSQNGTFINGDKLVGTRTLLSEDVISIGGASLVFHSNTRMQPAPLALELDAFRSAVEEEIERAETSGRSFAILAFGRADRQGARKLSQILQRHLRRIDRVARAAGQLAFVLVPEIDGETVVDVAQRLLDAVAPRAPGARVGYALYPRDGDRGATLLASARSAMAAASTGQPVSARDAFTVEALGERRALIADESMVRLYALLRRLAVCELPVLVSGETGTGKELAATAIHHFSARHSQPLVTLNCAAIQETLVESELFGHERGAFSGASQSKVGLLEAGDGGTVFLDEVGELPMAVQAKLLRALEYKRFTRVGGVREQQVDVRFVAATNRDLQGEVERGRFRADLFYRLNAATVCIPPLRDRKREIHILAQRFLEDLCQRTGREPIGLSSDALQRLLGHSWPGNVRELKNTIEYLAATTIDDTIDGDAVGDYLGTESGASEPDRDSERDREQRRPECVRPVISAPSSAPSSASAVSASKTPVPADFRPIKQEIRELEATRIRQALAAAGDNQTRAARLISMPLRTFIEKAKKYGILGRK